VRPHLFPPNVDQLPNPSQRMIPRNPLFQWNVAKNIAWFFVVSAPAAYRAELLNKCCTPFAYKLDFFRDL
jgi:hypothetical protein